MTNIPFAAKVKSRLRLYLFDGLTMMAYGLFSSLIIGLILSQLGRIPGLGMLSQFASVLDASSPVVGAAIGVSVSYGLGGKPLVLFSSAAAGAYGYLLGGPVGAYVAALAGSEFGTLVLDKTKVNIVVVPMATIVTGCLAGWLIGPTVSAFMNMLGGIINRATELSPLPMGIIVSVVVGLALTAPISSAALCVMLDLSGIAAGAACVGCCCQMVGFAVGSLPVNGIGGLISQGIGTSMLQFSNILKKPAIWLPPTITSAILGPVSTCIFRMENIATGAGMGTSGLVGQIGAFSVMEGSLAAGIAEILLLHILLPAVLCWLITALFVRRGWFKYEDMRLVE